MVGTDSLPLEPTSFFFTCGTLICTPRGDVSVDRLRVGDTVLTATGNIQSIVWVELRSVICDDTTSPVRVRAGAFGSDLPRRNTYIPPKYTVLVDADMDNTGGVLVPMTSLINGTTITREACASVTYCHLKIAVCDILLVEGLPIEGTASRRDAFEAMASKLISEGPNYVALGWIGRDHPIVLSGPLVEAERGRLEAVFAASLCKQCEWDADSFWMAD